MPYIVMKGVAMFMTAMLFFYYIVEILGNNDILLLCECKFETLYNMLTGNHYYRDILG